MKTNEQLKKELAAAWKLAVEKSHNVDGVRFKVYLDNDFNFQVLKTRTLNATYCVIEHDSYGVESAEDVDGVLNIFFDEIMAGVEEVE